MDTIRKVHETQLQVRHNAEEMQQTLNDLFTWEKEVKAAEQKMVTNEENKEDPTSLPVRSQNETQYPQEDNRKLEETVVPTKTPVKIDESKPDPIVQKRTEANVVKDAGNKFVKLGQYDQAINEYTIAIDIFKSDPVFYTNRALCYLKLERYKECIEDCERALDVDKRSVKAYYRRMQANECLGNLMDALKDCSTVLTIEPKNSDAKKSLERINGRLRTNVKCAKGPNFSAARSNLVDILPIHKPPYKRSNKPLRQVPIADVIGPKESKNCENSSLRISDEDIDKLFNYNCGPFVEVKKDISKGNYSTMKKTEADSSTFVERNNQQNKNLILDNNRPLPPPPTSSAQFYSNWKELSPAQRYNYMKSIDVTNLNKILGAGFDSDTLMDILHTVGDFYLPNKDEMAISTLFEVSKNNQVPILSLLMSSEERKVITDILNALKYYPSSAVTVEQIANNFNL